MKRELFVPFDGKGNFLASNAAKNIGSRRCMNNGCC